MIGELVVLACSKSKIWDNGSLPGHAPVAAKDAYTGHVFRYGRQYAERNGFPFLILSAKYGLLAPDQKITAYNTKLSSCRAATELRERFADTLKELFSRHRRIFMFGGNQRYRMVFNGFSGAQFDYIRAKHQADLRRQAMELAEA